ncbi:hypothetical protein GUJ93_ZPchr0011g28496 [Zizania palustris]|uniref:Peptidase C1A papain C-terminal domain-containing protein n=1 Tax=Zizania palustris TaxID=103762 RepID=A0A8J5WFW6_ZIZPA|nr:hypothetical protein GUJ93_ZPchr0011g28496 [Zizania palustris]
MACLRQQRAASTPRKDRWQLAVPSAHLIAHHSLRLHCTPGRPARMAFDFRSRQQQPRGLNFLYINKQRQAGEQRNRELGRGTSDSAMAASNMLLLLALIFSCAAAPPQAAGAAKPIPNPDLAAEDRDNSRIIQNDIIRTVNKHPSAGWTAAQNPYFANYTITQFKHILGVKSTPWSGHCGSCWAFAAVESLQDRFCIHFDRNISLSVNDLLSCCGFMCGDGCDGGYPIMAWRYFVRNGVVTNECDPYFDQTGCQHPGCEPAYPTPVCEKKCKAKDQSWREKKHFSVNAYRVSSDPHDIMAEIYQNGPAEVAFTVYEDFAHYRSGVYKHITGGMMGGHAVKLIGWGTTDAGEDYWLLANQWNTGWGDDGYFKIARGRNECGVEEDVVAGVPSAKNMVRSYGGAFGTAAAA